MAISLTFSSTAAAGAAALRDKKLDPVTGDLALDTTGDSVWVSGVEAIASDLKSRWLMFAGEYFLDLDAGVDYFGKVFVKAQNLGTIEDEFRAQALQVVGIVAVDLTLERLPGRTLKVTATATTDTGAIFTATLGINPGA